MVTKRNMPLSVKPERFSKVMTFVIPNLITNLKSPKLLALIIGSIVGLSLLIWLGLFVAPRLVDSSTLPALLELLTNTHSPIHLITLFLAGFIVVARIDSLFQVLLLSVLLILWMVSSL
ncbi:hypothetical protein BJP24_21660 [Aeromonas allosaccharophila]|nr:hypothetical protein BJP24_21660 [Aeromonas allosaccharophila]